MPKFNLVEIIARAGATPVLSRFRILRTYMWMTLTASTQAKAKLFRHTKQFRKNLKQKHSSMNTRPCKILPLFPYGGDFVLSASSVCRNKRSGSTTGALLMFLVFTPPPIAWYSPAFTRIFWTAARRCLRSKAAFRSRRRSICRSRLRIRRADGGPADNRQRAPPPQAAPREYPLPRPPELEAMPGEPLVGPP